MAIHVESVRDVLSARGHSLESTDFHTLDSVTVDDLVELAKSQGYQKPRNANGSRARYFFYAAQRKHARERRDIMTAPESCPIRCAWTVEGIEACFYNPWNRSRVVVDERTGAVVPGATNIGPSHNDFRALVNTAREHVAI